MQSRATPRYITRNSRRLSRRDSTGKVPSGSRYFLDPKHAIMVVIETEYSNSFLVRFMSEDKNLQRGPQRFTREKLEEKLTQAQKGLVYFVIGNVTGHVKATCLKNFLKECPRHP